MTTEKKKLYLTRIFRIYLWNYVPQGREWLLWVVSVVLVTWFHLGNTVCIWAPLIPLRCNISYIGLFSFFASLEGEPWKWTLRIRMIEKPQGKRAEKLPFCANWKYAKSWFTAQINRRNRRQALRIVLSNETQQYIRKSGALS